MNARLYNRVRDLPPDAFKLDTTKRVTIVTRKAVLLALAYRADKQGRCFISYRHLAADVGAHMFSVQRSVAELCKLDLLSVDVGDGRSSNTYTVLPVVTTPSMHKPDAAEPVENPVVTTRSDWGSHSEWLFKEISNTGTETDEGDGPVDLPENQQRRRARA